jgi:intracellular sulfur oxidation DsrE/DsrF family protein
MSALVRVFACTAPTLLVLLSTQGTFSQTADPLKSPFGVSPFGVSPAAEPVAKKIPGKTAHRLGVPATPQKSASQASRKKISGKTARLGPAADPQKSASQASRKKITAKTAQRLGPPVDPQKSSSDASHAADVTSKIPEKTAHRLGPPADPQKSASQASIAADVIGKVPEKTGHRLVLQVASNEPGAMNLALNNATNVAEHYRASGEKVQIEIVVYGPGLHMLRDDTSPVKSRIASLSQSSPNISFMACNNTQQNMQKQESKEIPLVPEAKIVKSGVVHVMELQEQGWTYVRP